MNPTIKKYVYGKRFRKCLPIVGLLFAMCLAGYSIKSSTAASSNDITMIKKVEQISPDIQFMPSIGVTLPNGIEKMAVWPSQEEIQKRYAKTDI